MTKKSTAQKRARALADATGIPYQTALNQCRAEEAERRATTAEPAAVVEATPVAASVRTPGSLPPGHPLNMTFRFNAMELIQQQVADAARVMEQHRQTLNVAATAMEQLRAPFLAFQQNAGAITAATEAARKSLSALPMTFRFGED